MNKVILSERTHLFEPNVYINFLVQIEGVTSTDKLKNSIRTAFSANEATMSKIVLNKDGTAFYQKMNESGCKIIVTKKNPKEIIKENEKNPFDIAKGELMRVFISISDYGADLLIMAHHLVGDGKSIVYFLEDIMNSLNGKKLIYKPLYPITDKSFPEKDKFPLFIKLYINKMNKKWKDDGCNFTWNDYYSIHNKYWNNQQSVIMYKALGKDETDKIKNNAEKIGISVNSYIVTAFLKADRNNKSVGIPVNIRENNNHSMSNQTAGIKIKYTYSQKISFEENAKKVHKIIYKKLNKPTSKYFVLRFISLLEPSLTDSVMMNIYGLYKNKVSRKMTRIMGYGKQKLSELGITNLTKLDIQSVYGQYKIKKVVFIPPLVSYTKYVIGTSAINGEMVLSYHSTDRRNIEKEREFFQNGVDNLLSM